MMGGLFDGAPPRTPILADLHKRWEVGDDPLRQRQLEDERASRSLGVEFMHVPLPDCVYRVVDGIALYPSEESLFGDVHPADFAPRLLQGIQIPEPEAVTVVYLPLAVGHHVDHQVVRDWGWKQVQDNLDRWAIRFYTEYPYSNESRSTERALALFNLSLEPADVTLTEADMQAKVKAIACYESQISTFWPSLPAMEADVRRAFTDPATGAFVERFWKLSR